MPEMMHETVVIGGGPAGSAVAIALARRHQSVCLLERKSGAQDKVCGEFISWEAAQYLRDLGVDLRALDAQAIRRVCLYNGEQALAAQLPFTGWSLSRRRLDEALLQQAELAGVDVRLGVAVRELSRANNSWDLLTGSKNTRKLFIGEDDPSGAGSEQCTLKKTHGTSAGILQAQTVFLASGKHDLRNWYRSPRRQDGGSLIGLKMHLRLNQAQQETLRETVEIHLFNSGYAGLEPIEDNKANLCFLITKDVYQACNGQWPIVLDWLSTSSSHMRQRLAGAVPLWRQPLAISGVPYGYIHSPLSAVPGLFRLGDQTAVIPSLAGDGIAIALHSAMLAARIYAAGSDSAAYHRQAKRDFQRPVRNAQLLAKLFSCGIGRKSVFLLGRICPRLITTAIANTRIHPI